MICRVSPLNDPLPHRLGFHRPLILVTGEEDAGWDPVEPLGTFTGSAGRDLPGAAVSSVVYNAATRQPNYHQEGHHQDR